MNQEAELQTDNTESLNEADSAPATGEDLEQSTNFDSSGDESENVSKEAQAEEKKDDDPARFTKRVNQITFEKMEEKRRADAAEDELAKIRANMPENQRPLIPELPDPYEENFNEKIAQRDKVVEEVARFDAKQQLLQSQQEDAKRASVAEQQKNLVKAVTSYSERAGKLNVSESELQVAGQTVQALGIGSEIASHILGDDQGPLLTVYLAKNPKELEKVNGMSPMQGAVYLETQIKPKAGRENPNLPQPADTLDGSGMTHKIEGPPGATYT